MARWGLAYAARIDWLGQVTYEACDSAQLQCAPVSAGSIEALLQLAAEIELALSRLHSGVVIVTPVGGVEFFGEAAEPLLAATRDLVFAHSCGPAGWVAGMQGCWVTESDFGDPAMSPIMTFCRDDCWRTVGPVRGNDWRQVPCPIAE